ncbi:MAG: signal peptidase I [Leptospiraceae bacterium]|nr:signal peptidase I [Leptospiraceae bacterium]MCP5512597.1 signal peptidase I [Leptospiraceae bacterium]
MTESENSSEKKKNSEKQTAEPGFFSSLISFFFIIVLVFAFKSSILDANNIPSGSMLPTLKIGDFLFVNKMRYSFRMPYSEEEIFRYDDPKRGDIVTFIPPEGAIHEDEPDMESVGGERKRKQIPIIGNLFAKRFVKRVVGMPGDELRVIQKQVDSYSGDPVEYTYLEFKENGSDEFKSYNPTPVPNGKELKDLDNTRAIGRSLFTESKRDFTHYVLEGPHDASYGFIRRNCPNSICKIPEGHYLVMGDNRDDSSDSRFWGYVKREDILGKALIIYFSINWKDYTCMFKEIPEDNELKSYLLYRYDDAELENHCHISELNGDVQRESVVGWLYRTIRFRIPRMEIRWERIGRILK